MKTQAAVVYEPGKPIEIEELELDKPQEGEVLIRYTHAGLCHSDVHVAHGDLEARLPMVLGHEGAGVIEEVGPGVTRVKVGDHVVCSFIPNCGTCRYCASGQQSICDMGATILEGYLPGERFPITRPARAVRRDVHARHLQPVRRDPPELRGQGRRRPAPGEGGAGRLRRPDRLGRGRQHRRGARRATPCWSSASAASASTPSRAPGWPARRTSSRSTLSRTSARRRWSSAPRTASPAPTRPWRR